MTQAPSFRSCFAVSNKVPKIALQSDMYFLTSLHELTLILKCQAGSRHSPTADRSEACIPLRLSRRKAGRLPLVTKRKLKHNLPSTPTFDEKQGKSHQASLRSSESIKSTQADLTCSACLRKRTRIATSTSIVLSTNELETCCSRPTL